MAIKPKFTKVWAETGVKEEVSESKISQGWVAERPPYQHENWSRNRQDQMLLHINEAGIAVWDEHTKYGQGGVSYVKGSDGVVYQSTQQSGGSFPVANPVTDRTRWKKAWVDSDGVITIPQVRDLQTELNKKVDKVSGKQLSTNDYTTIEKNKLGGIESGAQVNVPTNLTNTATTTTVTVKSSTGNNTTILNATSGRSGVMTSTDKVKLDNLPTGVGGVIPLSGGGTGATSANGARNNLGLKDHVTHPYGTTANSVAQGNDERIVNSVQTSGNQTISGLKTFSQFPVTPSAAPTANYQVANKKYVDDNSIGVGQTWQDVTASRNSGTTYTNSTGKPIVLTVYSSVGDDSDVEGSWGIGISVSGITVANMDRAAYSYEKNLNDGSLTTIVPHGETYSIDVSENLSIGKDVFIVELR